MKKTVLLLCVVLLVLMALGGVVLGQIATPNADVNIVNLIQIPGWSTSGAGFDLGSFNWVNRLMYFGDGTNHAVTTVDSTTNTLVSVQPIGCTTSSCPSGVQVAWDLQKLLASSRQSRVWIFDLRTPGAPPLVIDGQDSGYDEMEYDPIHQRFYVANTNAPYFLSAIDLVGPNAGTITARVPLPGAPEQPRFNVNDGLIYQTIPSFGIVVVDPNGGPTGEGGVSTNLTGGGSGSVVSLATCGPQGNDIDPISNLMLIGCRGTLNGMAVYNITTQQVLSSQPYPTNNDVLKFNPNTRRWYTGTGGNLNNGGNCPATNTGTVWPAMGVFAAPAVTSGGTVTGSVNFVGTTCIGRSGNRALVDTIGNNIYMNITQYPVDPNSALTGSAGIMALNDPAPTVPVLAASQATLGSNGTATFWLDGNQMRAFATLKGLVDAPTLLVVATSVGNETVACNESGGQATCSGNLYGTPVVGSPVDLANNGKIAAQGKTLQTAPLVVTNLSIDTPATSALSTYFVTITGSNLTAQTYFDIRVTAPGSGGDLVATNWQTGTLAPHSFPVGTQKGIWTITGVRAHSDPNNHTGNFVNVSTTLTVL